MTDPSCRGRRRSAGRSLLQGQHQGLARPCWPDGQRALHLRARQPGRRSGEIPPGDHSS